MRIYTEPRKIEFIGKTSLVERPRHKAYEKSENNRINNSAGKILLMAGIGYSADADLNNISSLLYFQSWFDTNLIFFVDFCWFVEYNKLGMMGGL